MKSKIIIMMLGGLVIGLTGCANGPHSGVVGWNKGFSSGSFAPDIPFTSAEGKEIRFNEIREPVAILAFISPSSQKCCSLRPDLVGLAKRFKHLPITVAQISLPTTECPYGPGCSESCNIIDENLVVLCDSARIAWKAYNQPKLNTVILVDKNDKIVDIQPINNLKVLANKAETMVDKIEKEDFFFDIDYD